jgi:hypothetical protein
MASWLRVLSAVCAVILADSCTITSQEPQYIVYRVTGTAYSSNISFTNETDGMDHLKSGLSPDGTMFWEKTVTLPAGKFAYLTAQNDTETGSVKVTILSGGEVLKTAQSSGSYCIATASVTVGRY